MNYRICLNIERIRRNEGDARRSGGKGRKNEETLSLYALLC